MERTKIDPKQRILLLRSHYLDRFCPRNPSVPSDVWQFLALCEARLMVLSLLLEVEPQDLEQWLDKLVWFSDLSPQALDDAHKEAGLPNPVLSNISACVEGPTLPPRQKHQERVMWRLKVWWGSQPVGDLILSKDGLFRFKYEPEWLGNEDAPAISLSLPKRSKPFSWRECSPYFGGLLPEGGQPKDLERCLHVSVGDDFSLLAKLGGEVAGALQFMPLKGTPVPAEGPWSPTPLDQDGLLRMLDTLLRRPLLAGVGGLRLTLAGAQSKVPVLLIDGAVALPLPEQPTTHILKPAIPWFDGTTENEAYAMRLAAAVGLEVAHVDPRVIRVAEGEVRTFLLVERYDRKVVPDRGVHRLHQEDFCQVLGVPSNLKYQSHGGPSLKQCFEVLRRVSVRPEEDVLKLLDAAIFNAVLGNADAHGKNFSILYAGAGPTLAPLYDLFCTAFYPRLTPELAMSIGGQKSLEDVNALDWSAFAEQAELDFSLARHRIEALAGKMVEMAESVRGSLDGLGLNDAALEQISVLVRNRAQLCLLGLARK